MLYKHSFMSHSIYFTYRSCDSIVIKSSRKLQVHVVRHIFCIIMFIIVFVFVFCFLQETLGVNKDKASSGKFRFSTLTILNYDS